MLPGGNVSHSIHASSHEMNSYTYQDDDEINSINNVENVPTKSFRMNER